MLIAFKALGATCLAGALAASGVVTTDHLGDHDKSAAGTVAVQAPADVDATTTTTEAPTTTTTEAPTTTTTAAPPAAVVALPPPVQPTVVPVAGAGTVVIVVQGPVIVVRNVKVVPGWIASVERSSGDINVVFRKGERMFRFLAALKDRRLTSAIREVRPDGEHEFRLDGWDGRDRWDGWDGRDGRDGWDGDGSRHRR